MTQQQKKEETKRDELSDTDLDKVSGGLVIDSTEEVVKPLAPKTNSFGGDEWQRK